MRKVRVTAPAGDPRSPSQEIGAVTVLAGVANSEVHREGSMSGPRPVGNGIMRPSGVAGEAGVTGKTTGQIVSMTGLTRDETP